MKLEESYGNVKLLLLEAGDTSLPTVFPLQRFLVIPIDCIPHSQPSTLVPDQMKY